ncbi:class I SAM-dependent methyltransferase [Solirubrobacter sp. CPCC 204708]|uniref:Cyclopropane-fatty-acyl-phospholipid synthase family protein n=1 Tax=Solirubrobacter deserti TaxID=2282478 RepID=A0ABT4RVC2_9ACTN|nr:cyclopropane-fatty-acyl-phospholipid synthase family protein [Solirubrobacter deserti]MBE2318927.1 class I SAM-dependent methyltransferase [Solirubrobacter deserti]MDA0142486.1 cyclopropane-fatty-acyl-phospholipid synthase family protein [Solirubrobacter deserti]
MTEDLRAALAEALPHRPFTLRLWDGTELPATSAEDGPTFILTSPVALGHILRAPSQLGVGRAYVSGGIEVDDMDSALALISQWSPPPMDNAAKLKIARGAVKAGALRRVPRVPAMEFRPKGARHSILRDKRSVTHHYNLSNEFFSLFLDESMTYSCAIWSRGAETLEEAQRTKLELVCTKLGLKPGMRVLDVGCGWGAFAIHAAREHGVHVTGITLSEPQAELARERAAGLDVDIRVMDYRELQGQTFDAIASIGMVEHVGSVNIDAYMAKLASLLKPGGTLLNHGIARLRVGDAEAGPFSERYVWPDAAPLHVSRIQTAIERAGLHTRHVEDFPDDYARTLLEWQRRFEANIDRARELAGDERVRVWRIYLRVSRQGFESGFMSPYQVRAEKPR